jgi:hypothetical protein
MNVNKKNLQDALEIVKPGLASKELIEQSTSFAFIKGRVVTYNDEISVSHPVKGLELEGAIKAAELYSLLSKIKKEEIEFSIDGNEIKIVAGRSKAGFTLQSEIKLPLDEDVAEKGKWKDLPENFIKFLGFAMSSCAKGMSKPVLTCVHVSKDGFIESSDDYRITQCNLGEELPFEDFLIPATSAVEVVKLQPTKIAEGKGWIHFQTEEETIISCRIFEDPYPNISPLLQMDGIEIILPKTIEEALDKAMVFAKRDHLLEERVDLILENNRLKISSSSDSAWFEEEINFSYKGEAVQIGITPYLLKGILSETQACEVSEEKLKFQGEGWIYVTALKE